MKKLLLLSTVAVAVLAAANLQARDVEVDINVNGAVREDVRVETNEVRHSDGKPCMYNAGQTFNVPEQVIPARSFTCPDTPVCPKCTCKAVAVEECSTCNKAPRHHKTCKGGSCGKKRHHRSREVVEVDVE